MNNHICKAKEIDTGEWIYGYYLTALYYLDDSTKHIIFTSDTEIYPRNEFIGWYEVDPDTLCRYTGVNDKNGNPIFEHDVVMLDDGFEACVRWDQESALYEFEYGTPLCFYEELEVIGNKFDNGGSK